MQGELEKVNQEQVKVARDQGKLNEAAATVQQLGASEKDQAIQQAEDQRKDAQAAGESAVAQAKRQAADEDAKFKSMGYRSWWADKSNGTKALAAIGVALSGLGNVFLAKAGRPAQNNGALDIIRQAIDHDYQIQRDNIAKQKESARSAKEGVGEAEHSLQARLALLDNDKKNKIEGVLSVMEKRMRALGIPQAQIDADSNVLALRKDLQTQGLKVQQEQAQIGNLAADTKLKGAETAHAYAEANKANAGAAAAGGGKPPSDKALFQENELEAGIQKMRQAQALLSPKVWKAVRDAREQWTRAEEGSKHSSIASSLRGIGQMRGTTPIAAEQYITQNPNLSPAEKQKALQLNQLNQDALAEIGKTFGPILTKSHQAVAGNIASIYGNDALAQHRLYGGLIEDMQNHLDLIRSNRNVRGAEGQRLKPGAEPAAPAAGDGGLPPGAVRGTYKGFRGYRLGGKFYVDDSEGPQASR